MPDLIAQGPEPEQRWRRKLPSGKSLVLGRATKSWAVPWDNRISATHARLIYQHELLSVERAEEARNPIFYRGLSQDRFQIAKGEHFVIGSTTFTLLDRRLEVNANVPPPLSEQTIAPETLRQLRFRDADRRIDLLSRLPRELSGEATDASQAEALVRVLIEGISAASFVAVIETQPREGSFTVLHWDQRALTHADPSPSERLIRQATESQAPMIHTWQAVGASDEFTRQADVDWAFCLSLRGPGAPPWVVYAAGSQHDLTISSSSELLQDEVKFTDIVTSTLCQLRAIRLLERQRTSLGQFISPVVMETLELDDPEIVLAPREAEVAVLFCDLRGFSRRSEREAADLFALLRRVSGALGVMTRQILAHGGVVGDFHGDSAMGFWGWPLPVDDAAARACSAALCIRDEFDRAANASSHALAGFRVGIGIASGPAVAGKIGTPDHVKVTVFGPVVNLAARLQDLTKTLRAPILMDEVTAHSGRALLPAEVARFRRVARIQPAGFASAVEVSELLPPRARNPVPSDEGIAAYEAALDALLSGDWERAFSLLHHVPAEDRVKDFLTVFIAQHNRTPPDNWQGFIPLPKG